MITRQELIDRGFTNGDVHGQLRKYTLDGDGNIWAIDIQIKDDGIIKYIDLECEVYDNYINTLSMPTNTPIEDIDNLIRILNL